MIFWNFSGKSPTCYFYIWLLLLISCYVSVVLSESTSEDLVKLTADLISKPLHSDTINQSLQNALKSKTGDKNKTVSEINPIKPDSTSKSDYNIRLESRTIGLKETLHREQLDEFVKNCQNRLRSLSEVPILTDSSDLIRSYQNLQPLSNWKELQCDALQQISNCSSDSISKVRESDARKRVSNCCKILKHCSVLLDEVRNEVQKSNELHLAKRPDRSHVLRFLRNDVEYKNQYSERLFDLKVKRKFPASNHHFIVRPGNYPSLKRHIPSRQSLRGVTVRNAFRIQDTASNDHQTFNDPDVGEMGRDLTVNPRENGKVNLHNRKEPYLDREITSNRLANIPVMKKCANSHLMPNGCSFRAIQHSSASSISPGASHLSTIKSKRENRHYSLPRTMSTNPVHNIQNEERILSKQNWNPHLKMDWSTFVVPLSEFPPPQQIETPNKFANKKSDSVENSNKNPFSPTHSSNPSKFTSAQIYDVTVEDKDLVTAKFTHDGDFMDHQRLKRSYDKSFRDLDLDDNPITSVHASKRLEARKIFLGKRNNKQKLLFLGKRPTQNKQSLLFLGKRQPKSNQKLLFLGKREPRSSQKLLFLGKRQPRSSQKLLFLGKRLGKESPNFYHDNVQDSSDFSDFGRTYIPKRNHKSKRGSDHKSDRRNDRQGTRWSVFFIGKRGNNL